jgi:hypothetical protein
LRDSQSAATRLYDHGGHLIPDLALAHSAVPDCLEEEHARSLP